MKKRIAYLLQYDITKNDGVTKKIKAQVDAWRRYGANVTVFCMLPVPGPSILEARQFRFSGFIRQRLFLSKHILREILDFSPDIIYFRYDIWSRDYSWLADRYKVVCELNTLDIEEFWHRACKERTLKAWARYFAYKSLRKYVLGKAAGIVSVTHEIMNHPNNLPYIGKGVVLPNAIALDEYPKIKSADAGVDEIELFFIGTPDQSWHGVDIIEEIALNLPGYKFHIVGMTAPNKVNVFYHGYLSQRDYVAILKRCHICIGSLALYRNNMSEACPLKVREYLSYGYPVVLGYRDTAFLFGEQPRWLHRITRDIDYSSLVQFIKANAGVVVGNDELAPISISEIERRRLEFFWNV